MDFSLFCMCVVLYVFVILIVVTFYLVSLYSPIFPEQGQGDVPSFYTYEEGLSRLTSEGQTTLERLEGMLAESVAQQYHMAGVRTESAAADFEGDMVLFRGLVVSAV